MKVGCKRESSMIWNSELLSCHTTENERPNKRVGEGGRKEKIKARWSKVIFVFPWQEEMKARENMGQTSSTWPFFFLGRKKSNDPDCAIQV